VAEEEDPVVQVRLFFLESLEGLDLEDHHILQVLDLEELGQLAKVLQGEMVLVLDHLETLVVVVLVA
jgi:hypothetical protein